MKLRNPEYARLEFAQRHTQLQANKLTKSNSRCCLDLLAHVIKIGGFRCQSSSLLSVSGRNTAGFLRSSRFDVLSIQLNTRNN